MLLRSAAALIALCAPVPFEVCATEIDENELGGWYMVFFNKDFTASRFGFQGDVQYRTWNGSGDS